MPPSSGSYSSPAPLRILHLEDDSNDAAFIAWALRTAGIQCRVIRVEDEESYVAALHRDEIDLILSDCNVRGFSGFVALEMAQAAKAKVPFVFVSGSATPAMRTQAMDLGATECLSKDHRVQLIFLAQRIWQNKLDD